ncbi:MAG: nitrophenyl compound nitroreductase subunit ArsF family protein [Prolixibacteraceae bacterium]|jgi:hypothetical protein|nr:nitrophenyl compound nitroreductase subunit ArsF family protein [Prolixibacteraceae bacterium]
MKRMIAFFLFIFTITAGYAQGCYKQEITSEPAVLAMNIVNNDVTVVKAYYFHATRRCATCQAVESVTREALKEYYGNQVVFQSVNREKDNKNPLIKKYKIRGQTLLIVKGDKVINLTNEAFLYARTKPDQFKAKLKSVVDSIK